MSYYVEYEKGISDYFFCEFGKEVGQKPHIHSHIEIVFVFEGILGATVSEKEYTFSAGEMFVIMPYEIHSYFGDATTFVISCPLEYFQERTQFLNGRLFSPIHIPFGKIERDIIFDIVDGEFKSDLKKKALMYYVFSGFVENCTLSERRFSEYDTYRRAVIYITENFKDNITLRKTALAAGVSEEHLSRMFNSSGKAHFSEILNSLRVNFSKQKLMDKSLSISDIALESGFGSIRNFNRIFKKHFNCTPSEFRKNRS